MVCVAGADAFDEVDPAKVEELPRSPPAAAVEVHDVRRHCCGSVWVIRLTEPVAQVALSVDAVWEGEWLSVVRVA